MKFTRIAFVLVLLITISIGPAQAANKDIVELQTQVQQLQQQMTAMTRSFDERMGVMRNLLEQNTDA
ncbi:MAG: transporter, partial [Terriglobales bacterium]